MTIEQTNSYEGIDFSDKKLEKDEPDSLCDIEMRQVQNALKLQNFSVNGHNGFYDAGNVDFDSVIETDEKGYTTGPKPCIPGHVYVVRTYEDNYAKFIVKGRH